MDIDQVYEQHVRSLSLADQLRLAAHIVAKAAVTAEASPIPPAVILAPPDPADRERWSEWMEAALRAGGERLAAE
jgi:hypothetical protein